MQLKLDNPYPHGIQHDFWEMCVRRDLEAFVQQDWSITKNDFDAESFLGIHANGSHDPLDWSPDFSTLAAYQDEFNKQSAAFAAQEFEKDPLSQLGALVTLSAPKVNGDKATIVKSFNGRLRLADGSEQIFAWKSLFHLKNNSGRWLFTGFVGYLPLD